MSASVIIPTTGSDDLRDAIESVLSQTYGTECYVVCDGENFKEKVKKIVSEYSNINVCYLPINVGSGGYYGHRIYASFTHLINTDYVLYLDQDCFFDNKHVEELVNVIENNNLDWSYSLRKICDKSGKFLCYDNCESLGKWKPLFDYNHIDTNCYCIKRKVAVSISNVWHGGWGQDRIFFNNISKYFPNFDCSKEYSTNYKLNGNEGSVSLNFFENGNKLVESSFKKFPWNK